MEAVGNVIRLLREMVRDNTRRLDRHEEVLKSLIDLTGISREMDDNLRAHLEEMATRGDVHAKQLAELVGKIEAISKMQGDSYPE